MLYAIDPVTPVRVPDMFDIRGFTWIDFSSDFNRLFLCIGNRRSFFRIRSHYLEFAIVSLLNIESVCAHIVVYLLF